nr:uncharacterized protein LOC109406693 [Aedes albopictus]XP_029734652.1 uncharacterized protein LOC115269962 [Aedes albopictus]
MSHAILVSAVALILCGILVSGAPTNKETTSVLSIEKQNNHHEFDLSHKVKRNNGQNAYRGNQQHQHTVLDSSVTATMMGPQAVGPSAAAGHGDNLDLLLSCSLCAGK